MTNVLCLPQVQVVFLTLIGTRQFLLLYLAKLHDPHHILLYNFSLKVTDSHKDYANFYSGYLKELI